MIFSAQSKNSPLKTALEMAKKRYKKFFFVKKLDF
jgi:hypothetical protein